MTKEELKKLMNSNVSGLEVSKAIRAYWNLQEDELYNTAKSIFINEPEPNGTGSPEQQSL